jgi:hypothetical protein
MEKEKPLFLASSQFSPTLALSFFSFQKIERTGALNVRAYIGF